MQRRHGRTRHAAEPPTRAPTPGDDLDPQRYRPGNAARLPAGVGAGKWIVVASGAGGVWSSAGCSGNVPASTPACVETTRDLARQYVNVTHPATGPSENEIVLPGNLMAYNEASIFARTNGYLKSWSTDIGAKVDRRAGAGRDRSARRGRATPPGQGDAGTGQGQPGNRQPQFRPPERPARQRRSPASRSSTRTARTSMP